MPAPKVEDLFAPEPTGPPKVEDLFAEPSQPSSTSPVLDMVEGTRRIGLNLLSGLASGVGGFTNTGAQFFHVADEAAKKVSERTGLSYGGAFQQVESQLRPIADRYIQLGDWLSPGETLPDKAVKLIGNLPGGVAEAVSAVAAGGPVAGFAGLGALHDPEHPVIGALAGAALGSIFKATETGVGRASRAVTVGVGSAALDVAQGKPTEEVALSAGANALFAALGARPPQKYNGIAPQAIPPEAAAEKPRLKKTGVLTEAAPAEKPSAITVTPRTEATATEFLGRDYSDITPPDRVINLNLNRIQGSDDLKAAMADMTESLRPQIDQARRGQISLVETERLAEDLGMTRDQLMQRRRGQAFSAEEATAARTLNRSAIEQWWNLAKKIKANKATNEDRVEFLRATAVVEDVLPQVLGATAEAGRALSAFRIRVGPSTQQMKELRTLLADWKGPKGEALDEFAALVAAKDSPEGLAKFGREWRKATTGDKLIELWINGLFAPPGITANAISNSLMAAWAPAQTLGQALSSKIRGVPSSSPEAVPFREAFAMLHGMLEGTGDGLRLAAKVFRTETAASPSELFGAVTSLERPFGAIGTAPEASRFEQRLGKIIRIPSRTLMSMDAFAQAMAYRQSLRAQAVRIAVREGKSGASLASRVDEILRNPSEEQTGVAYHFARRQTFTEELGKTGKAIQQFANSHNLARLILPFTRTPINILKMSLRSTPASPLLAEVRSEWKQGGAARDMVIAQTAMGSMVMAYTAYLAANDQLTGSGPADKNLREAWLLSHQPFSVKVGDSWVSYARVEPLATVLGLAADYSDISGHLSEDERDELATRLVFSFRRNLASKTFLQGLSNAVEAVMDPVRSGGKFIQGLAGSIVPGPVATAAHIQDPVLRDTRSMIDRIKSRIPGYSADLPPKRNVFGEPILLYGGVGPDMVSPLYRRPLRNDKTVDEVVRLEAKLVPPAENEPVKGLKLSPQEYSEMLADYGPRAKAAMDLIVSSPMYSDIPDAIKRKIFEDIYADQRKAGREAAYARIVTQDPIRLMESIHERVEGAIGK